MINNIAVVTYTNSICEDIWPIYFGQLDKYGNKLKSYVFSDKLPSPGEFEGHTFLKYNNENPYYMQYNNLLESLEEEYIIYCQEDFFLQSEIDYEELKRCLLVLENTDYSFVRLVKTDIGAWKHSSECKKRDWEVIELDDNIYCAHSTDFDAFSFQMQATLWKKSDMINLYNHVKSEKWLEDREWDKGMRETNTKGSYYYKDSAKEGPYHWAPEIWPYVCTAVGRGKWTLSVHGDRLLNILNEYSVDIRKRGIR